MHRFAFYPVGEAPKLDMKSAILLGADGVPMRGDVRIEGDAIVCDARTTDALALSVLWPIAGRGVVQLETTRVPPRGEPYHLHVELARHRLMRISTRREEWGLYDYPGMEAIVERADLAQNRFIEALQCAENPRAAARKADEAIAHAVLASEEMCAFHAGVFLSRRKPGTSQKPFFGAGVAPALLRAAPKLRLADALGFARVPIVWREIQPKEQGASFDALDAHVKQLQKEGLALRSGPLLSFGVQTVPDWMYIWENDYEAIAEFAREHIRRTVQRYASQIGSWIAASGLHADSVFSFNFEQIMDLTRLAAATTKQVAPRAQVVIEITQPWGEYYVRNPRTIAPTLYAEMLVQSGVPFDAFGLQLLFGLDSEGFHFRDQMQIAGIIDRLANLGKPIHLTAVALPSERGGGGQPPGGWTEAAQADWIARLGEIALSRPYVESLCFQTLVDGPWAAVPFSGLVREAGTPKPAFEALARLRSGLPCESAK